MAEAASSYRRAKEEGYRARSAYKLIDVDAEFEILRGAERAIDLCASPGSWSQVLSQRLPAGAPIVAVDLQHIAPLADNVTIIKGDITSEEVVAQIVAALGGQLADVIVCDGAPEVTGLHDLDEHVHAELMGAAIGVCRLALRDGGHFCAKIFRASDSALVRTQLRSLFERVDVVKPLSSRERSVECFVIGRGFVRNDSDDPAKKPILDAFIQEGGNLAAYAEADASLR
ncbi:putative ribosomal RNA methyltransferase [Pelagophyceae sp. CCMP2097]|nr:putative ribosomal RNA methyltransferase [Pelagophyceae sp. CCMP2097]